MSGESTQRKIASAEAFERAFGERAACNRCRDEAVDYRVIATFLHDTVAVRAYCPSCYEAALEGEYHARGDGAVMGYEDYVARFGSPGPSPPPRTPVDGVLAAWLQDPRLLSLVPGSESLARRRGPPPYRFRVVVQLQGREGEAELAIGTRGAIEDLSGDPEVSSLLRSTSPR